VQQAQAVERQVDVDLLDAGCVLGDECGDAVWTGSIGKRLSHEAAFQGSVDIMQWLHSKGMLTEKAHSQSVCDDPGEVKEWGIYLPLYCFAAEGGSVDALRWLHKHTGWDDIDEWFAYQYAASAGSAQCLQWLMQHGSEDVDMGELIDNAAASKDLDTMKTALNFAISAAYNDGSVGTETDLVNRMLGHAQHSKHAEAVQWLRKHWALSEA